MKTFKYALVILISLSFFSCNNVKEKKSETSVSIKMEDYADNLSSGTIKRIDSFPSQYVRARTVDVWLPNNYSESEKYAVLYMHDGQMLFDANSTWNKQEWKVDEIIGDLIVSQKIKNTIVVAMWNHSDIRWSDYCPKKPFDLLPKKTLDSISTVYSDLFKNGMKSDNYLKFIVEEVKPFIDANFSVYTNAENTFVSGSSIGGLISMYAVCEYPKVFGGAACLSTHWPGIMPFENNPIPEAFFSYLAQNLPSPQTHKIYFDFGTETLDEYYLPFQHSVDEVLKMKGYDKTNSKNLKFEGHDHSENSWNQRFQIPVAFLLKK